VRGEALRAHRQALSVGLKNVHRDWSYERTPDAVNVFDVGIKAAWQVRCEPNSSHALPTAAMYSITELS
jgi:hypothetical protein